MRFLLVSSFDDGDVRPNPHNMGVQVKIDGEWVEIPEDVVLKHRALPPPPPIPWSLCQDCGTRYRGDFIWAPGLCQSCARMHEGEKNARVLGEAVGAGPYRTPESSAKGNQLPRWLVLLGKAMCFVGLHTFKWIPTPYHVQCRRCGKTSYVGP